MRFVNQDNRLLLLAGDADAPLNQARGIDLHTASGGAVPAEPATALATWPQVLDAAREAASADADADVAIDPARLGSPSPNPRQIFGIGINYADHGAEAGMERPEVPLVFTKLSTSVTGPFSTINLPTAYVDWEVELVVVIGAYADHVSVENAWDVVAGLTGGQDLSERQIQWRPKATPQFGLGKSLPGFSPMGPTLVTPDELADPENIELSCAINGEEVQHGASESLLFSVSELIAYLSEITPLLPGDAIFTGTPSGVGMTRTPPRYLKPGDELVSHFAGIGTMVHKLATVPAGVPAAG